MGDALNVTIIAAEDAPADLTKQREAEAESIIKHLSKGNVAKVEPDDGQTLRGLRVGLGRAAKETGVTLQMWDADSVLYVKLLG